MANSGAAGPPVPAPLSTVPFPLDPTRYWLLGQLEYYMSPQNMAQDFYLRQQMDARGWIPISLFTSFNRVKTLIPPPADEEAQTRLVGEVLTLSSLVQVRGGMVRMGGWERYVLPDAKPSEVDESLPEPRYVEEEEVELEEDDSDEDVVFVMGAENHVVSWSSPANSQRQSGKP
ncbi:hypothetical protein CPC08DRAFT_628295 [Agrocybe pediades]|nr:hypothetical protein CPC08DRAFT_628295 [Agrocybe pediades]